MKIVVLDGYTLNPEGDNPWTKIEKLGELTVYPRLSSKEIVDRAKDAEIILTNKVPLSAEVIERLDKLRLISILATGYNIVDGVAALHRNIPVCNVPEYSTTSVAQFTFALLLELCHHVGLHSDHVHAGEWTSCRDFSFTKTPLKELYGKTFGIVGFGRIGRVVASIAQAFGMHVICTSRTRPESLSEGVRYVSLSEVFTQSDVVSLHCPLTKDNQEFVNEELIGKMKSTAFFLNVSRGGLVHEEALAYALNTNRIAGAAVDVLSTEPPSGDNPLLNAKNCIITPHIAWAPIEARRRVIDVTEQNIKAFYSGNPINVVNDYSMNKKGA